MAQSSNKEHRNRLSAETSPYLLQHASNPVDWYPWGPEALRLAVERDRPILLSIGYAACHWCHVMEHESFEDAATARMMNDGFVCIKVDREERPDIDRIYQLSHQMMMRRGGGWPLTVFLTPKGHAPIFAGTYFPREARHGLPGFVDVLTKISEHYEKNHGTFDDHDRAFKEALGATNDSDDSGKLNRETIDDAVSALRSAYDAANGGFGGAPKFPHPTNLALLLSHVGRGTDQTASTPTPTAYTMLAHTLRSMAHGGIYDHLGGGFCRYSVDERWEIPHFEKMLYDNAQLLSIYADAYAFESDDRIRRVCYETAAWVLREMQAPEGGYYSTIDADSEGEEGKFYVFDRETIKKALTTDEWRAAAPHFGLDLHANFESKWHLVVKRPIADVASEIGVDPSVARGLVDGAREKLFALRARRVAPAVDDKVLCSWNGLMIGAMARAGRQFREPAWIDSARRAIDFIRTTLYADGRLSATSRAGKVQHNAYLDDYVYCIDGLVEFLQTEFRTSDLQFAIALADAVLAHFPDEENGGFYFTSDDHESLIHRPKPGMDDATPSGNGIAAKVLQRLGHLVGEQRYLDAAARTFDFLGAGVNQYPAGYGSALTAAEEFFRPPPSVVLRTRDDVDDARWRESARTQLPASALVVSIPSSAEALPGVLVHRQARADVTAYVCRGFSCSAPVTTHEDFSTLIREGEGNDISGEG